MSCDAPDAPAEREADRAAAGATGVPTTRAGGGEPSPGLRSVLEGEAGRGDPLPDTVRESLGSRLGADLRDVRVHHDGHAHRMATGLGARAFTYGSDIYFRDGAYDPSGADGRRTLDHEVAHTVQQAGASATLQRQLEPRGEEETASALTLTAETANALDRFSGRNAESAAIVEDLFFEFDDLNAATARWLEGHDVPESELVQRVHRAVLRAEAAFEAAGSAEFDGASLVAWLDATMVALRRYHPLLEAARVLDPFGPILTSIIDRRVALMTRVTSSYSRIGVVATLRADERAAEERAEADRVAAEATAAADAEAAEERAVERAEDIVPYASVPWWDLIPGESVGEVGHHLEEELRAGHYDVAYQVIVRAGGQLDDNVVRVAFTDAVDLTAMAASSVGRRALAAAVRTLRMGVETEADTALLERMEGALAASGEARDRGITIPFQRPALLMGRNGTTFDLSIEPNGDIRLAFHPRVREEYPTLGDDFFSTGVVFAPSETIHVIDYDDDARPHEHPATYLFTLEQELHTATFGNMGETLAIATLLVSAGFMAGEEAVVAVGRLGMWLRRLEVVADVFGLVTSLVDETRGSIVRRYGDAGREFVEVVGYIDLALSGVQAFAGLAQLATALPEIMTDLAGRTRRLRELVGLISADESTEFLRIRGEIDDALDSLDEWVALIDPPHAPPTRAAAIASAAPELAPIRALDDVPTRTGPERTGVAATGASDDAARSADGTVDPVRHSTDEPGRLGPDVGATGSTGLPGRRVASQSVDLGRLGTHRVVVTRVGDTLQLWLCTRCGLLLGHLDDALRAVPPDGPTASLHRRLVRLRDRVTDIESRLGTGALTIDDLPRELNQVGAHLRDLSHRHPEFSELMRFQDLPISPEMRRFIRTTATPGTHIEASRYNGGKHVQGATNAERMSSSSRRGPGQFFAELADGTRVTDPTITGWERRALSLAREGKGRLNYRGPNDFQVFVDLGHDVGYAGGAPTSVMRVDWTSGREVHSHPRPRSDL